MRWEGLEPSTSWISPYALPAELPSLYKYLKISRKKIRMVGLVAPTFHYSLKSP